MNAEPWIVAVGTLDTKGPEIAHVRSALLRLGARPLVVDSGILGEAAGIVPDVTRNEVAAAAGCTLEQVRRAGSRGAAVELMAGGVREVCLRLRGAGRLDGILCIGGAEGALLGAGAMQALPLGVPKLLVSPSLSGRRRFGAFVGRSDILLMHSVVDILGLNPIARAVFDNAAAAVVGMARHAGTAVAPLGGLVGITMLGNTTPGVMRLRAAVEAAGYGTVVFHANGVGGTAMEECAASGGLAGVIDYTLAEISNTLMDGLLAAGPERLRTVGLSGLPQVVVPGCVDFFNQPAPLPEAWRGRKFYYHNPVSTLVRLLPAEMAEVGRMVAQRLNEARGPLHVVLPTRGLSLNDVEGGNLWDPEADAAFAETLAAGLRPDIPLERVDTHVNDPGLAELVALRFLALASAAKTGDGPRAEPVPVR